MTTGLDRIIEAINLSLDKKMKCLKIEHPNIVISSAQMAIINSYRAQLVAHATQIYVMGSHAIDNIINDILNQFTQPIMESINNKLIPEEIEWVVTHGLYPDLVDEDDLAYVKDVSQKTIDQIFKIIGEENIQIVANQIKQLEDLLEELSLSAENIEIECSELKSNSSDTVVSDNIMVGEIPSMNDAENFS